MSVKHLLAVMIVLTMMPIGPSLASFPVGADKAAPRALQSHAPISIEGNANFTLSNGVVAGSGTVGNPYIIEKWSIDDPYIPGLIISDTTAHFIVRDCYFHNQKKMLFDAIELANVSNGDIESNVIDSVRMGFYYNVSNNLSFNNNLVRFAVYGALSDTADQNITMDGNVIYNVTEGFEIGPGSRDVRLSGNTISNTTDDAIYARYKANNITITDNLLTHVKFYGIDLFYANDTMIANNTMVAGTIKHYGEGFSLWDCSRSTIRDNHMANSTLEGLEIAGSGGIKIINNTINNNSLDGLRFFESDFPNATNYVIGNDIYNNEVGIIIPSDNGHIVMLNNRVHSNFDGMEIYSPDIIVSGNDVYDCHNTGVTISVSDGVLATDNLIHDNNEGLVISTGSSNTYYNNKMFDNSMNFGLDIWAQDLTPSKNILTVNNTVDGRPMYYWVGQSDKVVPKDAGFVGLFSCHNITAKDIKLTKNLEAGMVQDSTNVTLDKLTINESYYGLVFVNASVLLTHSYITSTQIAVYMFYSQNDTLRSNTFKDNFFTGPYLSGSSGIVVEDNQLDNCSYYGIFLARVSNSTIIGNSIHNSYLGIYLYADDMDDQILNNDLFLNNYSIGLEGWWGYSLSDLTIANNTIHDSEIGISLTEIKFSQFFSNLIFNNINGIIIGSSAINNTFYNNFLNNDLNIAQYSIGSNIFNISKTPGTNIVGGPYLGGNYWSDYHGWDLDGDLLGDTDVPFSPGDMHPLIDMVHLQDDTKGPATTGDNLTIDVIASFRAGNDTVTLRYMFDNGTERNLTVPLVSGNASIGEHRINLSVPSNATVLQYNLTVNNSHQGNFSLPNRTMTVIDNDAPVIEDLTGPAYTGQNITFLFNLTDNFNITSVDFGYRFDNGNWTKATLLNNSLVVLVPSTAQVLQYNVTAKDPSGNIKHILYTLNIIDIEAPIITDQTIGQPITGEQFNITCKAIDNWGVKNATVTYRTTGNDTSDPMVHMGNIYSFSIVMPLNATTLNYTILASDGSDNTATISNGFTVIDDIPPTLKDTSGTPTTGDPFQITAELNDNIGFRFSIIDYSFDGGTSTRANFFGNITIQVPFSAMNLYYNIRCQDYAGHLVNYTNTKKVKDNDAPNIDNYEPSKTPETGRSFTITVNVDDNRAVRLVYIDYWIDGVKKEKNMTRIHLDFTYKEVIDVPVGARNIRFIIHAEDESGNNATSAEYTLTVHQTPWYVLQAHNLDLLVIIIILLVVAVVLAKYKTQPSDDDTKDMGPGKKEPKVLRKTKRSVPVNEELSEEE